MPIKAPSVESVVEDPNPFKADVQAPKPIRIPKLSKTEQAKQESAKFENDILKAQNAAVNLFNNDPTYQRGSFRLKRIMVDNYKSQLGDFYNDPNRFKSLTPEQRTQLQTSVADAVEKNYKNAYDTVYTSANKSDYRGGKFGIGTDQLAKGVQELGTLLANGGSNNEQRQALQQQIDNLQNGILERSRGLDATFKAMGDPNDPVVAANIENARKAIAEQDAKDTAAIESLHKEYRRLSRLD